MGLTLVVLLCLRGLALLGLIQKCMSDFRRRGTRVRVPARVALITLGSTRRPSFPDACSNVRRQRGVDRAE